MGSLVELLSPKLISDMDTVVSELIKGIVLWLLRNLCQDLRGWRYF